MKPWWTKTDGQADGQPRLRAVAYYRHSAEIGQENSVEIDLVVRHPTPSTA